MKKKKFLVMLAALLTVGSFAGYKLSTKETASDSLELANVEALAADEFIQACDNYCYSNTNTSCILITNYGFHIDCVNMKAKI